MDMKKFTRKLKINTKKLKTKPIGVTKWLPVKEEKHVFREPV